MAEWATPAAEGLASRLDLVFWRGLFDIHLDPLAFIDRKEVRKMDLFIQFALAAAELAVRDSGLPAGDLRSERAGTYVGSGIGGLGSIEEWQIAQTHKTLRPFTLEALDEVLARLGDRPIYLTLDMDVLDPSLYPGTGTPEPGGITWDLLIQGLKRFRGRKLVGMDLPSSPANTATPASSSSATALL